jgi:hypothetical protein
MKKKETVKTEPEPVKYIIVDEDMVGRALTEDELQIALREKSYWIGEGMLVYVVSGHGKITNKFTFEEDE